MGGALRVLRWGPAGPLRAVQRHARPGRRALPRPPRPHLPCSPSFRGSHSETFPNYAGWLCDWLFVLILIGRRAATVAGLADPFARRGGLGQLDSVKVPELCEVAAAHPDQSPLARRPVPQRADRGELDMGWHRRWPGCRCGLWPRPPPRRTGRTPRPHWRWCRSRAVGGPHHDRVQADGWRRSAGVVSLNKVPGQ